MKKSFLIFFFLTLCTLPILRSLFPPGYFTTHDGIYHLVRLAHFYAELRGGQFPVRWASSMALGYGYPVFNYFYPLFYYIASIPLFFGASFGGSLKIIMGLSIILSTFFSFLWLRKHTSVFPATIGSLLFLYSPIRLLILYVIGTQAANAALVFVPLILLSLYEVIEENNHKYIPILSFASFTILTIHNSSTLMFFPVFLFYSLVLLFYKKRDLLKNSLPLIGGFILSLSMAAFFLLPVAFEKSFVRLSILPASEYQTQFPTLKQLLYSPWGYGYSVMGDSDGLSFQVGLAQWSVLILSLLLFLYKFLKHQDVMKKNRFAVFWFLIFLGTIFMMLPTSNFIWKNFPILQDLQYPWKLLPITSVAASFLGAFLVSQKYGKWLALILLLILIKNNFNYLRPVDNFRRQDLFYEKDLSVFFGTADTSAESLPVWTKKRPPDFPIRPLIADGLTYDAQKTSLESFHFSAEASQSTLVIRSVLYFPSWNVTIDGQKTATQPFGPYGLLSFILPPGQHKVVIEIDSTPIEKLGDIISLGGFIIWGILSFYMLCWKKSKL